MTKKDIRFIQWALRFCWVILMIKSAIKFIILLAVKLKNGVEKRVPN